MTTGPYHPLLNTVARSTVTKLIALPYSAVIYAAGGGGEIVPWITSTPGAGKVIRSANALWARSEVDSVLGYSPETTWGSKIPYWPAGFGTPQQALDGHPHAGEYKSGGYTSLEAAHALAARAWSVAALAAEPIKTPIGIAITATLLGADGPHKSGHLCWVVIRYGIAGEKITVGRVIFDPGYLTREQESTICAAFAIDEWAHIAGLARQSAGPIRIMTSDVTVCDLAGYEQTRITIGDRLQRVTKKIVTQCAGCPECNTAIQEYEPGIGYEHKKGCSHDQNQALCCNGLRVEYSMGCDGKGKVSLDDLTIMTRIQPPIANLSRADRDLGTLFHHDLYPGAFSQVLPSMWVKCSTCCPECKGSKRTQQPCILDPSQHFLVPAPLNPWHIGHDTLARTVAQITGKRPIFQISMRHPIKGRMMESTVHAALKACYGRYPVLVSDTLTDGLYIEKARKWGLDIAMGADAFTTLIQAGTCSLDQFKELGVTLYIVPRAASLDVTGSVQQICDKVLPDISESEKAIIYKQIDDHSPTVTQILRRIKQISDPYGVVIAVAQPLVKASSSAMRSRC